MKHVKIRLPSGKVVIRSRRAKASAPVCANCKEQLHGMRKLHASEAKKLSKTEMRPSRAYGGYFCASCTKELFKAKARMI